MAIAAAARLALLEDGQTGGWVERIFQGQTRYTRTVVDGEAALQADASGTASGLYREAPVSLARWPILRWRWRVAAALTHGNERTREGDDFVARVYVVARHRVFPWKSRAVCYVWAATADEGDTWASPFGDGVRLVAVRSGGVAAGAWREERRDVAADFRRLFGDAPESIDAVAILTDTDQTGASATAWYTGIGFEAR